MLWTLVVSNKIICCICLQQVFNYLLTVLPVLPTLLKKDRIKTFKKKRKSIFAPLILGQVLAIHPRSPARRTRWCSHLTPSRLISNDQRNDLVNQDAASKTYRCLCLDFGCLPGFVLRQPSRPSNTSQSHSFKDKKWPNNSRISCCKFASIA